MSAYVVWKFVLPKPSPEGVAIVRMPFAVKPESVGMQDDDLVVWALVNPAYEGEEDHLFIVANTGMPLPLFPDTAEFLGTVTSSTGIVWHVWDGDVGVAA